MKILIVPPNWLGDLLFLTPALRAIRRAHPDSFIICLCPEAGMDLLKGNPHLNEIIPMKESRGFSGVVNWWLLVGTLRAKNFDTAFLFHRSFTRTAAVWLAGIRQRIGYRTRKQGWLLTRVVEQPPADSIHKAAWFLNLVEAAGIPSDGLGYDLELSGEDVARADQLLKECRVDPKLPLVALHPGANWNLKRWPAENFARLADLLSSRCRVQVIFVGGQGDLPLVKQITRMMRTQPFVATGRTTLRQSGALLKRARVLVSNDSGPLHLGVAVGTPVIGLFGPTVPVLTGPPPGAKAVTLFGSIGCPVPCYQLRCPANLCMHQISVEQVAAAAEQFLG